MSDKKLFKELKKQLEFIELKYDTLLSMCGRYNDQDVLNSLIERGLFVEDSDDFFEE